MVLIYQEFFCVSQLGDCARGLGYGSKTYLALGNLGVNQRSVKCQAVEASMGEYKSGALPVCNLESEEVNS